MTVGSAPAAGAGELVAQSTITAFSDIRLKDNIEYIKDAGEKLYELSGVLYKQKKIAEKFGYHDYSQQVGLIAQEVEKVLPEVTDLAPFDSDESMQSISGENYLTIKYERILPLIIETIKEQQKEIDLLTSKLQ